VIYGNELDHLYLTECGKTLAENYMVKHEIFFYAEKLKKE